MPADTVIQGKESRSERIQSIPVLAVSVLAIIFALLAMITSSRLSVLHAQYQMKLSESAVSQADSRKQLQVALDSANQVLDEEKKRNDQLKEEVAVLKKEAETIKALLANATKEIKTLQSRAAVVPAHQIPSPVLDPQDMFPQPTSIAQTTDPQDGTD